MESVRLIPASSVNTRLEYSRGGKAQVPGFLHGAEGAGRMGLKRKLVTVWVKRNLLWILVGIAIVVAAWFLAR